MSVLKNLFRRKNKTEQEEPILDQAVQTPEITEEPEALAEEPQQEASEPVVEQEVVFAQEELNAQILETTEEMEAETAEMFFEEELDCEEQPVQEPEPEESVVPVQEEPVVKQEPVVQEEKKEKKKGFFAKLKEGLTKTRETMLSSIFAMKSPISDEFYEELEEAMIIADMGMETTQKILDQLREEVKEKRLSDTDEVKQSLKAILADLMRPEDAFVPDQGEAVILIVGVNGVGKTTSIGKIAHCYTQMGRKPMLAAGDTFRAAAAEQLGVWAERANVPMVRHGEGADPAAVVFDSIASYKAKGCDLLICDTAGRLHNKKNLMNELSKMRRVIERELPNVPCEVLLVLDATTGQNAINQAQVFGESAGLTGIVLTKLDGTAKGGVVVAVKDVLHLPVRFVGVGEGIDDLQPFDADAFADALI